MLPCPGLDYVSNPNQLSLIHHRERPAHDCSQLFLVAAICTLLQSISANVRHCADEHMLEEFIKCPMNKTTKFMHAGVNNNNNNKSVRNE